MYRRKAQGWRKHIDFILLDLISLQCAFLFAFMVRNGAGEWLYDDRDYRSFAVILMALDALTIILLNGMHGVLKRGYYQELVHTLKHTALIVAEITLYLFMMQMGEIYSRLVILLTVLFYAVLAYAARVLWKNVRLRSDQADPKRSMLIATDRALAAGLISDLRADSEDEIQIVGLALLDCSAVGERVGGVPVVADARSMNAYICREWVDEVFVYLRGERFSAEQFIDDCVKMGVTVHRNLAEKLSVSGRKQFVEEIGKYSVLTSSINYATPTQALIKRLMDIAGGLVGSAVAVLLILFIGPVICAQSPGPVLFRQQRIGKNGKRFTIFKLRSMYMDADARKRDYLKDNRVSGGLMFKLDWDPRIIGNRILPDGSRKTGIGAFIRSTSLDEFPQFFNVLIGNMSLVGTRPPTVDEWEKYELRHRARLAIKPGITGLWQVSGRSNITNFEDVVKLDTEYICEWTPGLDLRILLKTFGAVLGKRGAM